MVIVEHNARFPAGFEYIDRGGRAFTGSSAASLGALASRKGYGLLGCNAANMFFLRGHYFSTLGMEPAVLNEALDPHDVCYVVFNHAGEVVLSNPGVPRKLRGVSYARPLKTWVRRALRMPTFYVLGDAHRRGGPVLKFLRWMRSSLARR